MNKTLTVGLVLAVLLTAAVGVAYPKADVASRGSQGEQGATGQQGPQGERGPAGQRGADGSSQNLSGLQSLLSALQNLVAGLSNQPSKLGAIPGTDLPNPYCQGNLCRAVVEGTCANATTTLARIDTPFLSASSTAVGAFVEITNPATSTARLVLATSTLDGFAPVPGNATSTGLINRVSLTLKATTTLSTYSQDLDELKDVGFLSRTFDVGPRSTTSLSDTLVLSLIARGDDSTAGWTDGGNIAACKYKVEFVAPNK